jgi:hypothetical protein
LSREKAVRRRKVTNTTKMTRMTRILRFLQFGSCMNDNNTINNITIATTNSNTGNTATASLCAFHSCFRKLLQKQNKTQQTPPTPTHPISAPKPNRGSLTKTSSANFLSCFWRFATKLLACTARAVACSRASAMSVAASQRLAHMNGGFFG